MSSKNPVVSKNRHSNYPNWTVFAQNIHCGYMLEAPWQGGFNEYPQSMFWIKSKKIGIPL